MTYTTDVEAYEALAKVKATKADILAFVRQLSVDVGLPSGTETVLYTGKIGDTDAYKFVNDMPDTVRKLDDRALATRVLKSDEFIKKPADFPPTLWRGIRTIRSPRRFMGCLIMPPRRIDGWLR